MAVALVYTQSGGGKTVNSVKVATKERGKNLLMCSDNSHRVLKNFPNPNVDIEIVESYLPKYEDGVLTKLGLVKQFEKNVAAQKYDCIILDNVSDIFDMAISDMDETGNYKDMRQAYQIVYQTLKRLVRKTIHVDCDVIFTAWQELENIVLPDGTATQRIKPKIPEKILDNILGLCNVIAHVETLERDGETVWFYNYKGSAGLYAKDQLYIRKNGLPEDIFRGGNK